LDDHSGKLTDTSPVMRLRQSLQHVRDEIAAMEARFLFAFIFVHSTLFSVTFSTKS
jgi:hypothetical protein